MKKKNQINILFTSVGRRVELIRAFRNAYEKLELEGNIIVTDISSLAPAIQEADKHYLVPRYSDDQYIPTLLKICKKEAIDLIFPLIDPDIPILAFHDELFKTINTKPVVVNSEASAKCDDKWKIYHFFKDLGINTPQSWLPVDLDWNNLPPFPLFIKPRHGSASSHTFPIRTKNELEFFTDYVPDPIIQEFLPGAEITNDVICSLDHKFLTMVSRQRIQVRGGEVVRGKTIINEDIISDCRLIAENLPTIGPITIQCIMNDGIPYFTEINARFGGGVPLGIAAGVNYPKILLANAANISIDVPSPRNYDEPLYLSRYDQSYYLTGDEVANLNRSRI